MVMMKMSCLYVAFNKQTHTHIHCCLAHKQERNPAETHNSYTVSGSVFARHGNHKTPDGSAANRAENAEDAPFKMTAFRSAETFMLLRLKLQLSVSGDIHG